MEQESKPEQYRMVFLEYGMKRHFETNCFLKEKGTAATELWYIAKGTVRAFCTSVDGDDITLFYVNEGSIIYTESLVPNAVIVEDAQTISPVDVYVLSTERFLQIWEKHGMKIQDLFAHLIDRFVLLHEHILCTHFRESNKRVAFLLYTCYRRSGAVISYTHEQIAAITGINRVSVNRILNDFARDHLLSLGYRQIRILDIDRLSSVFRLIGYGALDEKSEHGEI